MSDKQDQTNHLCIVCSGPARRNAKLHKYDSCDKSYRTVCAKLATVTIKNKPGEACLTYISKSMPSLPTLNFTRSRNTSMSSLSEAAGSAITSGGMLERVLRGFSESKTSIEVTIDACFNTFEKKLSEIDELGTRVTANEDNLGEVKNKLSDVEKEFTEIKRKLDDKDVNVSAGEADSILIDRVLNLGKKNADLSTRLTAVSSQDYYYCIDLVIEGLTVPSGHDLNALTVAVLASVQAELDARDIVAVRTLTKRSEREETPVLSDTTV